MSKLEIGILILAVLALAGLIYLLAVDKSTEVLLPIVSALVFYLLGKKEPEIVGSFKRLGGKKK